VPYTGACEISFAAHRYTNGAASDNHIFTGTIEMEEKVKAKIETAVNGLRDEMIDTLAELVR
jgi:hypothetical protein